MSDLLPPVIIEDILSRIPLKSLSRFRCVSKLWKSIIINPLLAKLRFQRHKNINIMFSYSQNFHSLNIDDEYDTKTVKTYKLLFETDFYIIWGSCNGLIFISDNLMKDAYLWNPYTSVHKFLYGLGDLKSDDYYYGYRYGFDFGFGYKTTTKDYEIIRISCCNHVLYSEVDIYSVRQCSWRKIQCIPYKIFPLYDKGKLVNGALHWVAKQYLTQNRVVLAYDINGEKFKEVPLPDCAGVNLNVMTLDEYLGVTCCMDTKFIVAWIMVDYGVRESWMKLYVINAEDIPCSVNSFGLLPLCFMKNGAEILLSDLSCLYSYDTVSQDFKEFKINNLPDFAFDATIYTESTVMPKTGDLKRKRTHIITGRRKGMLGL